jgi:hypothetical protein
MIIRAGPSRHVSAAATATPQYVVFGPMHARRAIKLPRAAAVPDAWAAVRAEVVSVIASTTNGCLSELGYFPGMVPTLAAAERDNALLRADNVKMFDDNRALAQHVASLSERVNFANLGASAQTQALERLQRQVQELTKERDDLARLVGVSPTVQAADAAALQKTVVELDQLRVEHLEALNQILHMRQALHGSTDPQIEKRVAQLKQVIHIAASAGELYACSSRLARSTH